MASKFCHECGKKILDPSASFCSGCGTNLSSLSQTRPVAPPKTPTFTPFSPERDDDDDDLRVDRASSLSDLGIQIDKLDIEVNLPRQNQETVAGVMSTGPIGGEPGRIKLSKAEKKKLDKANMAAFQQEGAAVRPRVNSRKNSED